MFSLFLFTHKCGCCYYLLHGVHFLVFVPISKFITLQFSIHVLLIVFFNFLFLLKALIGWPCNSSRRCRLVWRKLQFLRLITVKFGKDPLYANTKGIRFWFCFSQSFSCRWLFLSGLSTWYSCSVINNLMHLCLKNLSLRWLPLLI